MNACCQEHDARVEEAFHLESDFFWRFIVQIREDRRGDLSRVFEVLIDWHGEHKRSEIRSKEGTNT